MKIKITEALYLYRRHLIYNYLKSYNLFTLNKDQYKSTYRQFISLYRFNIPFTDFIDIVEKFISTNNILEIKMFLSANFKVSHPNSSISMVLDYIDDELNFLYRKKLIHNK